MRGAGAQRAPWRIALLRAVNLGPHGKLPMAGLRAAMGEAGFSDVKTLLASGNVLFRDPREPAALEAALEALLTERFGLRTDVMVRTPHAWSTLIAGNPFADMARADPSHMVLHVLKGPAREGALAALRGAIKGPEEAQIGEGAVYMTFPEGIGTSTLTPAAIGRALGASGTARNWNTVLKLRDACVD